jgi:mRNA-degrading endonuclease RelE of RelBE toxin-antitoxin system
MQLIYTAHFKKDYKKLSTAIQNKTDEKIKLLVENLSRPSLRVKKRRYQNVLEGSINKNYRFLFQITSKGYLFLRIGKHDILEK